MNVLLLSSIFACKPDADDPVGDAGNKTEVTDTDPQDSPIDPPTESCEDDPVDILAFTATEIQGQPFGRTLAVKTASEIGVAVTCALAAAPPVWEELVALQSTWRYVGNGVDPGPGWANPGFDDSGWNEAKAPFGADQDLVTPLGVADEAAPVSWFRRTFTVDDPAAVLQLRSAARRDDGIVVYVNGIEVVRDNVPVTLEIPREEERVLQRASIELTPGLLVAGENTLAVEIHQFDGSPDAGFDLRLVALAESTVPPETHLVEDTTPGTDHTMPLYGLLADATYTCSAHAETCGGGAVVEVSVVTPPTELPLPALALHPDHQTQSWGAYTLLNHQRPCAGDNTNRLLIIDPEGRPRWGYEIGMDHSSSIDIESEMLTSDTLLWGGGDRPQGVPQIVGLDGQIRYLTNYPGIEEDVYHHDLERKPDGKIVGLVDSDVIGPQQYGEGGDWAGFSFVEHDPATGQVTWRWTSQEGYDLGDLPPAEPDQRDPYHVNAMALVDDADGEGVYFSLFYLNQIGRLDRATGRIVSRFGVGGDYQLVDTNGAPLPDTEWFDHLHGMNLVGDLLFLYDNGWELDQSHAMALRVDSAAGTVEKAWDWTEFGWYEPNWGDVEPLPNGNVNITMAHRYCGGGHPDHPGALVEVDWETQEVLWRLDYVDSDDSGYKASRLDGCSIFSNTRYCPALAARLVELGLD